MFREDQLDSNVELGGWTAHGKNARVGKKTEAAACLCFGKGNSKKGVLWTNCMQKNEEEQFELAHRNV